MTMNGDDELVSTEPKGSEAEKLESKIISETALKQENTSEILTGAKLAIVFV